MCLLFYWYFHGGLQHVHWFVRIFIVFLLFSWFFTDDVISAILSVLWMTVGAFLKRNVFGRLCQFACPGMGGGQWAGGRGEPKLQSPTVGIAEVSQLNSWTVVLFFWGAPPRKSLFESFPSGVFSREGAYSFIRFVDSVSIHVLLLLEMNAPLTNHRLSSHLH